MFRPFRFLGSLAVAVPLLIAIAGVLAWGTIYEARFGTAAVQRFVYQSWWFQGLLGFLVVNLAAAALERYPWQRRHLPFVLAHIGIISILIGGIIGGRFGVDGQMIIPEGETSSTLQQSRNVLVVHQPNPGIHREFSTQFEATAWNHQPHALFEVPLADRTVQLVVDRYYPNSVRQEEISDGADAEKNPAVHLILSHEEQSDDLWLFARDPDRFGVRWGEAHILFLEPESERQFNQLLGRQKSDPSDRGIVDLEFPDLGVRRQIPVPAKMNVPSTIEGTPYRITFKQYFPDFSLSEKGPVNRSDQPNNPAVAFTLSGPEGTDVHLLFALHPEFPELHGRQHKIHVHPSYLHAAESSLPPNSIALLHTPAGKLMAVLTGAGAAGERKEIDPVEVGKIYTHPALGAQFQIETFYPRARRVEFFTNRDDEVRQEAIHLMGSGGEKTAQAWLSLRESAEFALGGHPLVVEYRPATREMPFSVKLLDFRKIDYPGIEMAAGFESDVELTDPERGVTLKRKITMNNPLKYRGYSLFQSSYVQGPVETTVLSVRNDPGTPLVYGGFLIVLVGVITLFLSRRESPEAT